MDHHFEVPAPACYHAERCWYKALERYRLNFSESHHPHLLASARFPGFQDNLAWKLLLFRLEEGPVFAELQSYTYVNAGTAVKTLKKNVWKTSSNQWVFQVIFNREDKGLPGVTQCLDPLRHGGWGVALQIGKSFAERNTVSLSYWRKRHKQHRFLGKPEEIALPSRRFAGMHGEHHPERMCPGSDKSQTLCHSRHFHSKTLAPTILLYSLLREMAVTLLFEDTVTLPSHSRTPMEWDNISRRILGEFSRVSCYCREY